MVVASQELKPFRCDGDHHVRSTSPKVLRPFQNIETLPIFLKRDAPMSNDYIVKDISLAALAAKNFDIGGNRNAGLDGRCRAEMAESKTAVGSHASWARALDDPDRRADRNAGVLVPMWRWASCNIFSTQDTPLRPSPKRHARVSR